MNEQEKLKAKIEQNLTDQSKLLDEQARLQDELSGLQKLKLGHGDYGLRGGDGIIMLKDRSPKQQYIQADEDITFANSMESHTEGYVKLGNIFDDLKRNSEDLEEFDRYGLSSRLEGSGDSPFRFCIDGRSIGYRGHSYCSFNYDEILEIGQKLIQMAHTAKRKK